MSMIYLLKDYYILYTVYRKTYVCGESIPPNIYHWDRFILRSLIGPNLKKGGWDLIYVVHYPIWDAACQRMQIQVVVSTEQANSCEELI